MIDFRIPKDPDVYRALAAYLNKQAEADAPFCEHCGAYADEPAPFCAEYADPDATIPGAKPTAEEMFSDTETTLAAATEVYSETGTAIGESLKGIIDIVAPPPPAETASEAEQAFGAPVLGQPGPKVETDLLPETVAPAPGVELDADGLPWDARIHAGSKLKKQREQTWKRIRGIDTKSPGLVEQVEAELRQALAASPANPVVTVFDTQDMPPTQPTPVGMDVAPPPPATVTAPGAPRMVTVIQCQEQVSVPIDKVIFPEFMGLCTASGFAPDVVLAAVNKAGLQSVVLLATRPDLIPVVIAELFPEA